ncbi:Uncharacterised protein [Listeria grayi]|nr:Uncharacterised protein [Listeria grayi]
MIKLHHIFLVVGVLLIAFCYNLFKKLFQADCPTCIGMFSPFILLIGVAGSVLFTIGLIKWIKNLRR